MKAQLNPVAEFRNPQPVIPPGLGVSTCEALELVTCLRCLGWSASAMLFTHDSHGSVTANIAEPGPDAGFDPEPGPLPTADVTIVPTPARWQQQDWALSNSLENLNRAGGEPTWIQNPDYPQCPGCRRRMHFLAQLDSLDFADGPQWLWEAAASPTSCGATPAASAPYSGNAPSRYQPGRSAEGGDLLPGTKAPLVQPTWPDSARMLISQPSQGRILPLGMPLIRRLLIGSAFELHILPAVELWGFEPQTSCMP